MKDIVDNLYVKTDLDSRNTEIPKISYAYSDKSYSEEIRKLKKTICDLEGGIETRDEYIKAANEKIAELREEKTKRNAGIEYIDGVIKENEYLLEYTKELEYQLDKEEEKLKELQYDYDILESKVSKYKNINQEVFEDDVVAAGQSKIATDTILGQQINMEICIKELIQENNEIKTLLDKINAEIGALKAIVSNIQRRY